MSPSEAAGGPQLSASGEDAGMTSASDPEIELTRRTLEALRGFDPSGTWEDVGPAVLPLLKRLRHPFPPDAAPMHLHVPPGIWTGFGIDIGAAWAHVSHGLFRRWGIDEATLLGTALENLRRRAVDEPPQVDRATVIDTPLTVVQAQGWGSALVLAPDRLGQILGPEPRTLLTPVRNALVALPRDVDIEVAALVWETFAEAGADELDVGPLSWDGRIVTAFGAGPGLAN
jgi:hypothetical protein